MYNKMEDILLVFALRYGGDLDCIMQALTNKEKVTDLEIKEAKESINCNYITALSINYPGVLKSIANPPAVLFLYGNISLLDRPNINIVGSNKPTAYGERWTQSVVNDAIADDKVIITEFEKGICETAIRTAIDTDGGKVVAFLSSGIEKCDPKDMEYLYEELKYNDHLIISEYPLDLDSTILKKIASKRLVSAFADDVVVIESREGDTTVVNISYAIENDKSVYCIPTKLDSDNSFNNIHIKNGANCFTHIGDIRD